MATTETKGKGEEIKQAGKEATKSTPEIQKVETPAFTEEDNRKAQFQNAIDLLDDVINAPDTSIRDIVSTLEDVKEIIKLNS